MEKKLKEKVAILVKNIEKGSKPVRTEPFDLKKQAELLEKGMK